MLRPFEALSFSDRCISVIGSGGKTTFLRWLSARRDGTVLLTTSTRIYPFPGVPLVTTGGDPERALQELRSALKSSRVVCIGKPLPNGKLTAPDIPFEALLREADALLIEADGAAGRPLKAHRPFEPVIPACSELTVCMVGASGLGKPAEQVCHCPELFCALAGTAPDRPVDEASVARVLNREALADLYLVNQTDALPDPAIAARLCDLIEAPAAMCSLLL